MNVEERTQFMQELFDEALAISEAKGAAYAKSNDSLSNFKEIAARVGVTKYQAWAVHADKHLTCIMSAIAKTPELPVDSTESMRGRIIDAVNYFGILGAMLLEDEK